MATEAKPRAPQAIPQASPLRVFQAFSAYQQTAALKAAIELDVFTVIARGNRTPEAIARGCQASVRGIRILCDFLAIGGFLGKDNDQYFLMPDTAMFLDRSSPAYMGSMAGFLTSKTVRERFDHLAETIRQGKPAGDAEGMLAPEHPIWVEFARSMAPLAAMLSSHMLGVLSMLRREVGKVLDIAAGHGLFGIAVAKAYPQAQVYGLDWQNVLEVAKENAAKQQVAHRYHTIPGDALQVDLGHDYDLVLIPNFIHHLDESTCVTFLRRVHAALKPGGEAVIVEFIPNDDRVTPPEAATFALTMLAGTPGDAYTYREIAGMLRNAGFQSTSLHDLPTPTHRIVLGGK